MNARQLFVLGASMLAAALATPSLSRQERHGAPLIARNARVCKRAPLAAAWMSCAVLY
jgi:hypothetical protein